MAVFSDPGLVNVGPRWGPRSSAIGLGARTELCVEGVVEGFLSSLGEESGEGAMHAVQKRKCKKGTKCSPPNK